MIRRTAEDFARDAELTNLRAAAEANSRTDAWQWVAILAFALGMTLYIGFVLGNVIRSQADTIRFMQIGGLTDGQ